MGELSFVTSFYGKTGTKFADKVPTGAFFRDERDTVSSSKLKSLQCFEPAILL